MLFPSDAVIAGRSKYDSFVTERWRKLLRATRSAGSIPETNEKTARD